MNGLATTRSSSRAIAATARPPTTASDDDATTRYSTDAGQQTRTLEGVGVVEGGQLAHDGVVAGARRAQLHGGLRAPLRPAGDLVEVGRGPGQIGYVLLGHCCAE